MAHMWYREGRECTRKRPGAGYSHQEYILGNLPPLSRSHLCLFLPTAVVPSAKDQNWLGKGVLRNV